MLWLLCSPRRIWQETPPAIADVPLLTEGDRLLWITLFLRDCLWGRVRRCFQVYRRICSCSPWRGASWHWLSLKLRSPRQQQVRKRCGAYWLTRLWNKDPKSARFACDDNVGLPTLVGTSTCTSTCRYMMCTRVCHVLYCKFYLSTYYASVLRHKKDPPVDPLRRSQWPVRRILVSVFRGVSRQKPGKWCHSLMAHVKQQQHPFHTNFENQYMLSFGWTIV
jgi:hypothetical protein